MTACGGCVQGVPQVPSHYRISRIVLTDGTKGARAILLPSYIMVYNQQFLVRTCAHTLSHVSKLLWTFLRRSHSCYMPAHLTGLVVSAGSARYETPHVEFHPVFCYCVFSWVGIFSPGHCFIISSCVAARNNREPTAGYRPKYSHCMSSQCNVSRQQIRAQKILN
jgi:hypothetical protein